VRFRIPLRAMTRRSVSTQTRLIHSIQRATVTTRTSSAAASAVSAIELTVCDAAHADYPATSSDTNGNYHFLGLCAGQYTVGFDSTSVNRANASG